MHHFYWLFLFILQLPLISFAQTIQNQGPINNGQFTQIPGPVGSGTFGHSIAILKNGNYAVADPSYDENGLKDIGAVFVYDGKTHQIIASLKGTYSNDQVGSSLYAIADNHLLCYSREWDAGKGAITIFSVEDEKHQHVTASNSVVGTQALDINQLYYTVLSTNKVILSMPSWNENRGAIIVQSLDNPITGNISSANAFVGTEPWNGVGGYILVDHKLVISTPNFNQNRGAVTILPLDAVIGEITTSNSLIGEHPLESVESSVKALPYSNSIVVCNDEWNVSRGAVAFIDVNNPLTGHMSATNSLIGNNPYDRIGSLGVYVLENGNCVIRSPTWNEYRGAVTWVDGQKGITGTVSATNSFVGDQIGDQVGSSIIRLMNGNYVMNTSSWNRNRGAVTWVDGNKGLTGTTSSKNSILGVNPMDGETMTPIYNYPLNYLMVRRPAINRVTIFNPYPEVITGLEETFTNQPKYTTLYPNPSIIYSQIKAVSDKSQTVKIKVVNQLGQTLLLDNAIISKANPTDLPMQELTPGTYIVVVQGNDFVETHKLIKQ